MYGYIYMIINKVNDKTYIGQRESKKFCHQDKYMGSGKLLKKAFKKYGKENFEKLLVQYIETKEEADKQEIFWIAHYRERGMAQYNIADGGHGSNGNSHRVGWHHSEETKRKISNSHIGIFRGREPWNKGEKGRHWYNNGIEEKMTFECPIGWKEGRLNKNKSFN